MFLAPPALWSGPRPTRSAARSRHPRAEAPPLPATCCRPCSLLRSQPNLPSHGRGDASSRPFRLRSLGRAFVLNVCVENERQAIGSSRILPSNTDGFGGAQGGHSCSDVFDVTAGVIPQFAGQAVLPSYQRLQTTFDDHCYVGQGSAKL